MTAPEAIERGLDALETLKTCIRHLRPDWESRALRDLTDIGERLEEHELEDAEWDEWRADDGRQRQHDFAQTLRGVA